MNITGSFTTTTPVAALTELGSTPGPLVGVSTLSDLRPGADGAVLATFSPVTALGRIPLATTITTVSRDGSRAVLRVVGRHGVQTVTVDLELEVDEPAPGGTGSTVTWSATLVVRGTAASVGQRVARDIAARAIGSVLAEAADRAGAGA